MSRVGALGRSRVCVLVVGAGAGWEPAALAALEARPELVVLKRCVDVTDLLATAASGQAQAAVVSVDAPGLDATAVEQLLRHEVRTVAVASGPAGERAAEIPAVNGHGTALALARFYAGLEAGGTLDGVRLLSPGLVAEATRPQLVARDRVLDRDVAWGLGFQIDVEEGGYGMGGLGGNLGWLAAEGYAVGYVTRRLGDFERIDAVEATVRDVLGRG